METATSGQARVLGSFDLENPIMREYLEGYTSKLADTLSETSYANFERILLGAQSEGLSVQDAARRLQEEVPELNRTRAVLISRTELHSTSEGARLEQARYSGVVSGKTWRHSGKANFRPEHKAQDGVTVALDERFPDGSDHPSDPNCACWIAYEINREVLRGESA